ncbi:MAG: hypothetical protein A2V88_10215 [Elusimicrobia bacterium RBG_16_66_12]|nr:MAG: hypothetical protein A2V88_10215 [Elusimicrobia bacterium RBG_16_66_12]
MKAAAAAATLLLLAPAPARAIISPPEASSAAAVAGIQIERTNVFDPAVTGENWWPFRAANKLHILTREAIIQRELLFSPGEPWDQLKVIESERNLRANGSFRRAEILHVPRPDGSADAVVVTQDAWTTNPKFNIGTEGGKNFLSYGIEEGNLLGYGKAVSLEHSQDGATISNSYGYADPRFLGSRLGLKGSYARNQNGDQISADLARPFYSLDAGHALGMGWTRTLGDESLVRDGDDYSKYRRRVRVADAAYGMRLTGDRDFVQRAEAGWYSEKFHFDPTPDTTAGTLPQGRELSGPTAGYSWVQPRYIKETYIDRIERVEDFNLGNELKARGGFMAAAAGSDRDRWMFNVSDQQGLSLGPGRFLLARVGASSRLAAGRWENGLVTGGVNLFWKHQTRERTSERTLVLHAEGSSGRFLDPQNQLSLGGNSGLRGYKNDSFVGGKSILFNLEDRFFFDREWFHLVRFGGVLFVDSGVAVPEGSGFSFSRFKTDLGAGLRLAGTRSRSGGVARIDVAYALNGGPGGSRIVVSVKGGQAFDLFSSSTRRVTTSPASRL